MRIQDALIAWNAPFADRGDDDPAKSRPRVIVVERSTPFPRGWSEGYRSTWGACAGDWRNCDDDEAKLEILGLFRMLALQGIDPLEIHRAFGAMVDYRHANGYEMSWDGDEFNP